MSVKPLPLFILSSALALAACLVGPDYVAPAPELGRDFYSGDKSHTSQSATYAKWWQVFHDPLLEEIITETTLYNRDIRVAMANVEKAKALRSQSAGGLFPSLSGSGDASRDGLSKKTGNTVRERNSYDASLDASWELDIFGGLRRELESSDASLEASIEEKRGVVLSALAEAAQTYFEVRGLQKRIHVTRHNLELLRETENIAKAKFEQGTVTELDVSSARGEREAVEATLPSLEAEMQAGIYRLSVLAGQPPEHYIRNFKAQQPLPAAPDIIPIGLRADILRRRPDIRAAERNLATANADIGVAIADLFPSFSLTGSLGSSALSFGDLFTASAVTYSLGSNLTAPLFEGGTLRAKVEEAKASEKAALATYEKTVLEALEEVEASLIRYGNEWKTLTQLREAEASRKSGFEIAKLRYESGEDDFLVMLDAERTLITAQNDVVQSETRILTYLTQLYKALGGGWQAVEAEKTVQKQKNTKKHP